MILGVDFDNTLVCYDGLFHAAAVKRGLMPVDGPKDKQGVRQWLIEHGKEADFTLLQGYVYGQELKDAKPYPGALECLKALRTAGAHLFIISHKTVYPYRGPAFDLRQAALKWLNDNGFFPNAVFSVEDVFFENTLEEKVLRVAELKCTHFIDDMERFLLRSDFPIETDRFWFHPFGEQGGVDSGVVEGLRRVDSWVDIIKLITK